MMDSLDAILEVAGTHVPREVIAKLEVLATLQTELGIVAPEEVLGRVKADAPRSSYD